MKQRFIGVMSGSSLDGVDLAFVEIGRPFSLAVLRYEHVAFDEKIRLGLFELTHRLSMELDQWLAAHQRMGAIFGEAIRRFVADLETDQITAIGFHGVTVRHCPDPIESPLGFGGGTLQLGDPHVIRAMTSIPVIYDFRQADMALGGQGAPLAPFLDQLLFGRSGAGRVLLNLGGIANLTLLTPDGAPALAFDSGPANMLIDGLMRRHPSWPGPFDPAGENAARGRILEPLLNEWLKHPYFARNPPKSTGREEFGDAFLEKLPPHHDSASFEDLLATATRLSAVTIADAVKRSVSGINGACRELIASGGGVHNQTLMGMIRACLPGWRVTTSSEHGVDADAKEAVLMAALAWAHGERAPGNFPAVTGARRATVLGARTG